jgi:outer membrane biosynthesis protein TonB
MSYQDFDDDKPRESFLKRNRIKIIVGVTFVVIVGLVATLLKMYGKVPPPHKPEEIVIHLQPLPPMPPPPPPPPPPPQPPEQKFVEQPKDLKPLEKKDEQKNPDKPPGPPMPAASGPPSDFGLGGTGGGGGGGGFGSGGSQYGPYAAEVIAAIKARLEANSKTSKANFHGLKTRIWADKTGRIIKASITGTTGDPAVDDALKNEVLIGLQLQEPPPSDMPMPIVLRISAERPN